MYEANEKQRFNLIFVFSITYAKRKCLWTVSKFIYTIHGKEIKSQTEEALMKTLELAAKQFLKDDIAETAKKQRAQHKQKRKFNYDRF